MDKQNKKAIMNIIYLFSGFVLISIIGGVVFVSCSRMETDANRYKKNKAQDRINREYQDCRSQLKENEDWKDRLLKCEIERMKKENKLTELNGY